MSESIADLRQRLSESEVNCAYWRGRAEAVESMLTQRSQPAATPASFPPELMTALLAAKMKEKKDAQEGA